MCVLVEQGGRCAYSGMPLNIRSSPRGPRSRKKAIWVNESGFYAMVLGSRKPHCVAFQRWVLQEVLPSIRRTGQYTVAQQPLGISEAQKACEKNSTALMKRVDRLSSRGVLAVRKSLTKQQRTLVHM